MNTRKTLLAALASGALLLPVVLAVPAYANPGGCSDENAGAAGQTLPRCGSDLLHVGVNAGNAARVNLNVGNGTCDSDTLLLIQVRANEHDAHQRAAHARDTYNTALGKYSDAVKADADDDKVIPPATVAAPDPVGGDQADKDLAKAKTDLDKAKGQLDEAREKDATLVARIEILTGRIGGVECHPVTTTPPPPPTTDVPPPPAQTIVQQPPAVIVPGPTTIIEPGPSQIGQAPQGFVSAGGGADAALVQAFGS